MERIDDAQMSGIPDIECRSCGGSGYIEMPEELWIVLFALDGHPNTAAVVLESLNNMGEYISVNAVNNRLERLRDYGFLIRKKMGRSWVYQEEGATND